MDKIPIKKKIKIYINRFRQLPTKFWTILLALFGFADFLAWAFLEDVEATTRWKIALGLVIFALVITIIVVIRTPTEEETLENARFMFRRARKLYNSKKYDDALKLLRKSVGLDPESTGTQGLLGRVLNRLGYFSEAIPHLDIAIEQSVVGANKRIHRSNRAIANFMLGNFGDSLRDFDANLRESPNQKSSRRFRAQIWYLLGESEKALEEVNKILEKNPDYICGHATKAIIIHQMGEEKDAQEEINKSEDLSPDDGDEFYCLAQAYSSLSFIDDALSALSVAIELDSKYKARALKDPLLSELRKHPEFKLAIEGLGRSINNN